VAVLLIIPPVISLAGPLFPGIGSLRNPWRPTPACFISRPSGFFFSIQQSDLLRLPSKGLLELSVTSFGPGLFMWPTARLIGPRLLGFQSFSEVP